MIEKLRRFSEKHQEKCTYPHLEADKHTHVEANEYVTDSKYEGHCNTFGFNGEGVYTFPQGTIYKGEFVDGMFEGKGTLIFPCGTTVRGKWVEGVVIRPSIFFNRLMYDQEWMYCKANDRRFEVEYTNFIQPAGDEFLTNDQPPKKIPEGYYDSGDGFYNPELKCIFHYNDLSRVLRYPSVGESKWIIENCRKAPEDCVGPRVVTDYPAPRFYLDEYLLSFSDLFSKDIGTHNKSLKSLMEQRVSAITGRLLERRPTAESVDISLLDYNI